MAWPTGMSFCLFTISVRTIWHLSVHPSNSVTNQPPISQPTRHPPTGHPNTQPFGHLPTQHPAFVHLPVKAAIIDQTGRPLCGVPFVGHNLTNPVSDHKSSHTIEANNQLQAPLSVPHLPPLLLRNSPSRAASYPDTP